VKTGMGEGEPKSANFSKKKEGRGKNFIYNLQAK
jgi:hypothetical protein